MNTTMDTLKQPTICKKAGVFKKIITVAAVLGVSFVFSAGCQIGGEHSDKDLSQLLQTEPDELTEAEYDKINVLTGSMSPEDYFAKYPNDPLIFELTDAFGDFVWGTWQKVDIPGAKCSDGSQYKVFVMRSQGFLNRLKGNDKKLLVMFEGGGACWDYESCSGEGGIRGASNPNGISDNYMNVGDIILGEGGGPGALYSPLIFRNNPLGDNIETSDWNKVFVPYCTGDVFSGNKTTIYTDSSGENPPLTYRHLGATNGEKLAEYLGGEFYGQETLMVTGFSAGGAGALTNYGLIRLAVEPGKGILLNDSGPIFNATSTTGNHYPLHQKIKSAWNTGYLQNLLIEKFPDFNFTGDLGEVNNGLAEFFPEDKIAITLFKRDGVYSDYSYGRFFGLDYSIPEQKEAILALWAEDVAGMTAVYDEYPNAHYYIPYYRQFLDSHTVTTLNWTGTEIQADNQDVGDFIRDLIHKNNDEIVSREEMINPNDQNVTDLFMFVVTAVTAGFL